MNISQPLSCQISQRQVSPPPTHQPSRPSPPLRTIHSERILRNHGAPGSLCFWMMRRCWSRSGNGVSAETAKLLQCMVNLSANNAATQGLGHVAAVAQAATQSLTGPAMRDRIQEQTGAGSRLEHTRTGPRIGPSKPRRQTMIAIMHRQPQCIIKNVMQALTQQQTPGRDIMQPPMRTRFG